MMLLLSRRLSHHQQTMTYGSNKQAKAHREVEHQRIKESNEPDVVLDELVCVEAMGGDNVGSVYEALDLYIKNGLQQP